MSAVILFTSFIALIFMGLPIAFSMGLSSLIYLALMDIPFIIISQKLFTGINSFVLLCIPGFVLAGNLMNTGGITKRIIKFSNAAIGHIRGGLSLANIVASMIFAGITGTAIADTTSLGAILIPAMEEEGYDVPFSVAVTAASSTIGPIIPPSLPMIIVGTLTGLSVSKLFLGGAIPGILLGLFLMAAAYIISIKRGYPKDTKKPFSVVVKTFLDAFWALMLTFIILWGILGGVFTPTEASIVASLYALIVGLFVYKELKIAQLPGIILSTMKTSAAIMMLVGFASTFGWILASEQIPQLVADFILSISSDKVVVLILINILLLFVGMFMETIAALIILFPVLLPVALKIGMDPIHFGVMAVLNLMIGLTTPPVGVCLFAGASIGKISIAKATKAILPFLAVSLLVLTLVTFIPEITLFLPNLLK
ncbi:MAG: TRAP transporter large permease [Clostridia bacterium]|nr:TRAP transporter large permease [Clostridia bacterium]